MPIWPFGRRRAAASADFPLYDPATNPYRARRLWPPDFATMDETHRFRLEKRYRRRSKMAYLRPGWVKGVKIAQWSICGGVLVYALLFMQNKDPKEPEPFGSFRTWLFGEYKSLWVSQPAPRPNIGRMDEQRRTET